MRPHSPDINAFCQIGYFDAIRMRKLVRDNVGVIGSRRQSPLHIFNHYLAPSTATSSRRPRSARQCAKDELPCVKYGTAMTAYCHIGACSGVYRAQIAFSVNSGGVRLSHITFFTDMQSPAKVKFPSLKGLFSSSKKRTNAQGQAPPEVQDKVPDR